MADEKIGGKCAHPTCRCPAQEDSEYCGEYCENARDETKCRCGHPECR